MRTPQNIYGWSAARALVVGRAALVSQIFDLATVRARELDEEKYRVWLQDKRRRFVVATNSGDEFLLRITVGEWEADKLLFDWTNDFAKALRMTPDHVRKSFNKVVAAFSGPQLICVE